jgi:hypothetical protein
MIKNIWACLLSHTTALSDPLDDANNFSYEELTNSNLIFVLSTGEKWFRCVTFGIYLGICRNDQQIRTEGPSA